MGGTNTRSSVLDFDMEEQDEDQIRRPCQCNGGLMRMIVRGHTWFVRDREFTKVVADHLALDLDGVKRLTIVDLEYRHRVSVE